MKPAVRSVPVSRRHAVFGPAVLGLATFAMAAPALAQADPQAPAKIGRDFVGEGQLPKPQSVPAPAPAQAPPQVPQAAGAVVQQIPTDFFVTAPTWSSAQARALLAYVGTLGREGLFPKDYRPEELEAAIASADQARINEIASRTFTWVAQDLRDGRTEMDARKQWFVTDPDAERLPIKDLLEGALAGGGIVPALESLNPIHPDYAVLKRMLAETPASDSAKLAKIRANMDRWRWLARDLGHSYLLTNVPEYQLRLTVNDKIVRSYRTVVGKPGRTSTPQLAETVEGVIFNPTWTVPQSIVVGEGLGAKVLGSPAYARSHNYKGWKNEDGTVTVVQQPGPNNSLGLMKLDMPNPHAIFLHDTPAKALFNNPDRAYSHGCIRTERALELALTLAMVLGQVPKEEAVAISKSGEYTKVPLKKQLPVYITYFTMAQDIDGQMRSFKDIYGRDEPVLASFKAPRVAKDGRRTTTEEVVAIEDPGL
ncbi:L,D-transpeptidase family protein [Croceicoccus sp. BE223]|uniref:L,D-transpeptidase family protein n=1 Tax=Croceicoccus sp. BE223 TaxID=2817716 RepID=UPI002856F0C9|nr:L,D-transpeptidase family protein [Croceicoccus sp. BE223]MDR7102102.1 murein L,D-transpeptidase YcbB/YkuD [Croceicoccus sp. BE223]